MHSQIKSKSTVNNYKGYWYTWLPHSISRLDWLRQERDVISRFAGWFRAWKLAFVFKTVFFSLYLYTWFGTFPTTGRMGFQQTFLSHLLWLDCQQFPSARGTHATQLILIQLKWRNKPGCLLCLGTGRTGGPAFILVLGKVNKIDLLGNCYKDSYSGSCATHKMPIYNITST